MYLVHVRAARATTTAEHGPCVKLAMVDGSFRFFPQPTLGAAVRVALRLCTVEVN